MAAADDRESAILRLLRERYHHVSVERVISGQGLVNLYESIAQLEGARGDALEPEDISRRADMGDPLCGAAVDTLRSEEHTSELQSLMRISYAVFCLKKKNTK